MKNVLRTAINRDTGEEYKTKKQPPTTLRTATNPDTGEKYPIEMPETEVVKQTILELDWPPTGLRIKDATKILAETFGLSDEQKNSVDAQKGNVFNKMVDSQIRSLFKEGVLIQPEGPKTRYFLVGKTPPEKTIEPAPVEENTSQIIADLADKLLQEINEKSPAFFEKLVIDVLVKMGYRVTLADAQKSEKSGDGANNEQTLFRR